MRKRIFTPGATLRIAKKRKILSCGYKQVTISRDHSYSSTKKSLTRRGERPEEAFARCEHDDPILMIATQTGYCARCLICGGVGPERQSFKEARTALLGAKPRY